MAYNYGELHPTLI